MDGIESVDEARAVIERQILDRYIERVNETVRIGVDEAMKIAREEIEVEHRRALQREFDKFSNERA